ncbi:spore germination protein [Anoxybacillus rupiensis]|jgi:spore germination protein KA|uniref:Spore germination protein n=1 Tax=Anoxybacteroides rupiense TaxID=311460 RepID=A0ABT5W4V3_9BACL|nr:MULTISPECIES: spore germination protein [Anoxybacillus]MBS2770629.1 spore germination protein [Anoxybacillus rupiensis]MDE8564346.1 spore germination protein [Anoxybacillus rupiensis]QHC03482.1 spore germination protein [Anoxybacillus sp. PDR2]
MSIFSFMFKNGKQQQVKTLPQLLQIFKQSSDFATVEFQTNGYHFCISYFDSLIDPKLLQQQVICRLQRDLSSYASLALEDLQQIIPVQRIEVTADVEMIEAKLLKGFAMIQLKGVADHCALVNLASENLGLRPNNDSENEFSVVGPKVGFVENIGTNLHLLRRQIVTPHLVFRELTIGSMSQTKVVIAYIDGIVNEQTLQTVVQRVSEIEFDIMFDTSLFEQVLSDNSSSPFPSFVSSERVDKIVYALIEGRVAIFSDGSPYVITGPSTLFDFFTSPEDYYLPWLLGSFFRLIRMIGVMFSILASPIYVAVLTYHYEMLPKDLLGPIIFSRSNVPFPPILEVLFLEITIELLREAGARLPTKVAQTLGIVGGIVIGQASVEAALTSNILLIIVALGALASFTTPIYKMSNTIRFIRFPIILFAACWGGIGIVFAACLLLIHLGKLQSFGSPYLVPLYPFRVKDFADSFIRSPYHLTVKRPSYLRPLTLWRYDPKKAKKKKDIDE